MKDVRTIRAARLLEDKGIHAEPSIAGHADDVLSVRAPLSELDHLRELAPSLKSLGFRYVTLELDTEAPGES
jgi:hypothetical protein